MSNTEGELDKILENYLITAKVTIDGRPDPVATGKAKSALLALIRAERIDELNQLISIVWDTDGSHYYKDDVPHEIIARLASMQADKGEA